MNEVIWSDLAFEQQSQLQKNQPKAFKKLKEIIKQIRRNPEEMLRNSEPLKYELSGFYSYRLNKKDRLVYRIRQIDSQEILEILECISHYGE